MLHILSSAITNKILLNRSYINLTVFFSLHAFLFLLSCAENNQIYVIGGAHYYTSRGISYYFEGNYELALADFNRAIKYDRDAHMAYAYRGHTYYIQKKYDMAILDYNKAIDISPVSGYYCYRGKAYYKKKLFDSAIKEFVKAIRLASNSHVAYNELAWLLATCSDKNYRDSLNAVKYARKAVDLEPESPAYLDTLAAAYAASGDFENAIITQEKVIQRIINKSKSININGVQKRLDSYKRRVPWTDTLD
jgi:tetratricopeptide (TPR) repeat protein